MSAKTVEPKSKTIRLTIGEWRRIRAELEGGNEDNNDLIKKIDAVLETIDKRYFEELS